MCPIQKSEGVVQWAASPSHASCHIVEPGPDDVNIGKERVDLLLPLWIGSVLVFE